MFWLHTFQLRSSSCSRPAPVASCEVVIGISKSVSSWMAFCASCRLLPTRSGMVQRRGPSVAITTVGVAWVTVTGGGTVLTGGRWRRGRRGAGGAAPHPATSSAIAAPATQQHVAPR